MTTPLVTLKSAEFGFIDIVIHGWRFYRALFLKILPVILCVYTPIRVIQMLILASPSVDHSGSPSGLGLFQDNNQFLEPFIGVVATLALAYLVERCVLEQETTWGAALRYGLSRWVSAIGTTILCYLIVVGLSLLFIIPGIIWGVYYTFWIYVVALRGLAGKDALDYSKRLVRGRWWSVLLTQFGLGLLVGIPVYVLALLLWQSTSDPWLLLMGQLAIDLCLAQLTVMQITWFVHLDHRRRRKTQPDD